VIDWFTVGAQIVNFLVLAWLMKRFLYRPILEAIDAREKGIAARVAEADAKEAQAGKDRDDFRQKSELFDRERSALLSKAVDEAEVQRRRLLDEAKAAADALGAAREEALRGEAAELDRELGLRVRREVWAIAGRTLADLAGSDLEERIATVFASRLRDMDPAEKLAMGAALRSQRDPAILRTAFDLADRTRSEVKNALDETFASAIEIRFSTDPDLIGGFELSTDGRKLSWNIAERISSMQARVEALVQGRPGPALP